MAKLRCTRANVDGEQLLLVEVEAPGDPDNPAALDLVVSAPRADAGAEAARAAAEILGARFAPLEDCPWDPEPGDGPTPLRAVLLVGSGTPEGAGALLREVYRAAWERVVISTFGLGRHDPVPLARAAELGGGRYTPVTGDAPALARALHREAAFLRGTALDGVELSLWGARVTPLLGTWRGRRGLLGPLAPGERRTLLLRLEGEGQEVALEAEVRVRRGRELHRVAAVPEVGGGSRHERVAFERGVARLYALYQGLAGLGGAGDVRRFLPALAEARAALERGADPRLPRLLQGLGALEAALRPLAERCEGEVLEALAREFLAEAVTLNSTGAGPAQGL